MATSTVTTGLVSSWAGSQNSQMIQSGSGPSQFTLNMTDPEQPTTAFNGSGVTFQTFVPGLRQWAGNITTFLTTPILGNTGLVTFSGGYVTNVNKWSLAITNDAKDTTAFNATPPTWRTFVPGLLRWGGTYDAYIDGTTAIVAPGAAAAAAVFKYSEDGATDRSFAGNIIATAAPASVQVGELPTVQYSYVGSGSLAATGTSGFYASGAIVTPEIGSLVLQAATGRTYTGDAFFTSATIDCMVGGVVAMNISFQGTGALTIA